MKIKIIESGFAGFTGELYGMSFKNGVTTNDVTDMNAARIGAAMRVERVSETEGVANTQIGPAIDLINAKNTTVTMEKFERGSDKEVTKSPEVVAKKRLTSEELGKIADAEGIAGLRRLADGYKIRGRSIVELTEQILRAQG